MNPMTGVLHGGWSFILAAYALSALALGGYALATYLSVRRLEKHHDRTER